MVCVLREKDTLGRETTLYECFCFPCQYECTLKGKNLPPWGANSSLFKVQGLFLRQAKTKSCKMSPLVKIAENLPGVPILDYSH